MEKDKRYRQRHDWSETVRRFDIEDIGHISLRLMEKAMFQSVAVCLSDGPLNNSLTVCLTALNNQIITLQMENNKAEKARQILYNYNTCATGKTVKPYIPTVTLMCGSRVSKSTTGADTYPAPNSNTFLSFCLSAIAAL